MIAWLLSPSAAAAPKPEAKKAGAEKKAMP
jgi:hypothetical protein